MKPVEDLLGLRRPGLRRRALLISQKLRRVLVEVNAKGFELKVAQLV